MPNQQLNSTAQSQGLDTLAYDHSTSCKGLRALVESNRHKMAALHTSILQQHSRSLSRQSVCQSIACHRRSIAFPAPAHWQHHIAPSPWHSSSSSSTPAAAAAASAALTSQPDRINGHSLHRLCKNVLVGMAAAAAWSVAASVFGGSSSPLASLTIASNPGASGGFPYHPIRLCMHCFITQMGPLTGPQATGCLNTWQGSHSDLLHVCMLCYCVHRCSSSSTECMGGVSSWFPAHTVWARPPGSEYTCTCCNTDRFLCLCRFIIPHTARCM
jgi:hypothetical protein